MIQKYISSTRIKPQRLQELQPRNRRTLEVESSKLSVKILKFTGIKLKGSKNINKPQIGEALWIQASKAPKNFHHKPSKMKNT